MTGPEHYAEAERLLAVADQPGAHGAAHVARAQVHGLLALAGAIVDEAVLRNDHREEWDHATGRTDDAAIIARARGIK